MASYELSALAKEDAQAIWDYIYRESRSTEVADQALERVLDELDFIADAPMAGHIREELAPPSIRFRSVFSYLIAYRMQETTVEIIAVFHGARDQHFPLNERL